MMKAVVVVLFAEALCWTFGQPVHAAATYTEKVLWSFGSGTDGRAPFSALLDVNGILYGTTPGGGIYNLGTVFSFDPSAGIEKTLYAFCIKGEFCLDGAGPSGPLVEVGGLLYGTAAGGGENMQGEGGGGTVFSLAPDTGREKTVYSFCAQQNCADGANPRAGVIFSGGLFFGTTDSGGTGNGFRGSNTGTAFELDRKTRAETVLYSFCDEENCTDGSNLIDNGLTYVNGILYGTTATGGADYTGCQGAGCGTIYAIDPKAGTQTVLYSFQSVPDGASPSSGLTDVNGVLFGATYLGGISGRVGAGRGTIFSFDPGTGTEKVIYAFCSQQGCPDGQNPDSPLIDVKGTLYGTTVAGGAYDCGTVFSVDPGSGAQTVVYSFQCGADGRRPGAIINVKGILYGVTSGDGSYGYGTLFALTRKQ